MTRHLPKALLRPTSLLLAIALAVAPLSSHAITVFGIGAEAEQIVAAIAACQAAVTTLQQATNSALNTMRRGVNPGEYVKAFELQQQNLATLNQIQADLQRIGFTASNIQRDYNNTFLSRPGAYKDLSNEQLAALGRGWQERTHTSIRTALTALARVSDVRVANNETNRVLEQSRNSSDQVAAQIQASNQLLANLSTQISSLTEALVSSGRVSAEAIAVATAEKQREEEITRRALDDYGKKDSYQRTMSKLP